MFDGVHLGHRHLFAQLRELCRLNGLTPLVFTFPKHPLQIVNPAVVPPLLSEPEEKLALMEQCGFSRNQVEFLLFDSDLRSLSAREFIAMLRDRYGVTTILRGFNNRFGTERNLTPADYRRIGLEENVQILDATELSLNAPPSTLSPSSTPLAATLSPSSSEIRARLMAGDIATANLLLGYPYPLSGTVEPGKQLGRQLGFPTANIHPDHPDKLLPSPGVYICTAILPITSEPHPAMVNIGMRPTIDGINNHLTIEANILNLDADLYGLALTIQFHHRLRGEIRFASLSDLRKQLATDREATLRYFVDTQKIR